MRLGRFIFSLDFEPPYFWFRRCTGPFKSWILFLGPLIVERRRVWPLYGELQP